MNKKFRITLELIVDTDKWDSPGEWKWDILLHDNFHPMDNFHPKIIASEEIPMDDKINPSRN